MQEGQEEEVRVQGKGKHGALPEPGHQGLDEAKLRQDLLPPVGQRGGWVHEGQENGTGSRKISHVPQVSSDGESGVPGLSAGSTARPRNGSGKLGPGPGRGTAPGCPPAPRRGPGNARSATAATCTAGDVS